MDNRNYGIDLLKILAMYMVVILHVLGHGGILSNLEMFSLKYNLAWLLEISCYCAVNCYALITGYVMIDSKFRYKKIFYLWIDVLFWGMLITTIFAFVCPGTVIGIDFLKSILNVTYNQYWYFSSYFALFFFIPFINKLILSLDYITYKRLIVTIIILMSFIGISCDSFSLNSGYSFLWLLSLYFIGAYVKKFNIKDKVNKIYILFVVFIFILLTFVSKLFNIANLDKLINYNSFTILFISIGLLLLFANLKIKNKYFKGFVKIFAPATFGVYLIHVHPVVWREIIENLFVFLVDYGALEMILLVLFYSFILDLSDKLFIMV